MINSSVHISHSAHLPGPLVELSPYAYSLGRGMTSRWLHVTHLLVVGPFIASLLAKFHVTKFCGVLLVLFRGLVDAGHYAGARSYLFVVAEFHPVLALSETLLQGCAHVALLTEVFG